MSVSAAWWTVIVLSLPTRLYLHELMIFWSFNVYLQDMRQGWSYAKELNFQIENSPDAGLDAYLYMHVLPLPQQIGLIIANCYNTILLVNLVLKFPRLCLFNILREIDLVAYDWYSFLPYPTICIGQESTGIHLRYVCSN